MVPSGCSAQPLALTLTSVKSSVSEALRVSAFIFGLAACSASPSSSPHNLISRPRATYPSHRCSPPRLRYTQYQLTFVPSALGKVGTHRVSAGTSSWHCFALRNTVMTKKPTHAYFQIQGMHLTSPTAYRSNGWFFGRRSLIRIRALCLAFAAQFAEPAFAYRHLCEGRCGGGPLDGIVFLILIAGFLFWLGPKRATVFLSIWLLPTWLAWLDGNKGLAFLLGIFLFYISFIATPFVCDKLFGTEIAKEPKIQDESRITTKNHSATNSSGSVMGNSTRAVDKIEVKAAFSPPLQNQFSDPENLHRLTQSTANLPTHRGVAIVAGESLIRGVVIHGENLQEAVRKFIIWAGCKEASFNDKFFCHGFSQPSVIRIVEVEPTAHLAAAAEALARHQLANGQSRVILWPGK